MHLDPPFRAAIAADARHIAELVAIASDGVALIDWHETAAGSGVDPLDVGARCYAASDGDYSYRNTVVAELQGRVAGMLLTFAMPPHPPDRRVAAPPFDDGDVFAPYIYLEAPKTWYVCGIAFYPEFRGQGLGNRLLDIAHDQARERGYAEVSLVAFEQNRGALRLYAKRGYRVVARAPVVPHPLIEHTGDALLMVSPA